MAELHETLKGLGPVKWSDIPTSEQELEAYLTDLFSKAQLIVDSVPLPAPGDAPQSPPKTHGRARNASEVSLSSERSAPPPLNHEQLQKEWGKPMKMKPQENALGVSLYKMSSKDGRGSWFARHSVHEGIGFSKFKKSLQMEFEKSLAEQGPPGAGNVRGIGGEERVEQIKTGLGTVEVYRLSAQFPGPTAARDFVTLLVTSDKAMNSDKQDALGARHYLVVSRPCDHPKTQPRSGFVRGFYESIEFIREVPRKLKTSHSWKDGGDHSHHHNHGSHHHNDSHGRHRAATAGQLQQTDRDSQRHQPDDLEDNPVEWFMITRSDPGGGIPRFLVDRGTPSSICADAVKFVDWACSNEDEPPQVQEGGNTNPPRPIRRESHQSWRGKSLAGIVESEQTQPMESATSPEQTQIEPTEQHNSIFDAVAGAAASLRPYTPQVILDRLPGTSGEQSSSEQIQSVPVNHTRPAMPQEDNKSFISTSSFASAEDHLSSVSSADHEGEPTSPESLSITSPTVQSKDHLHHEKEVEKLNNRKKALDDKFTATQSKFDEARTRQAEIDTDINSKTSEKHARELQKHQEKYQKELRKIEEKQEKERRKFAQKQNKQVEKDKETKLTRERDEARQQLDIAKKEVESLRKIVGDLQRENTALAMKTGKAAMVVDDVGVSGSGNRSRTSSLSRSLKEKTKEVVEGVVHPDTIGSKS